MKNINKNFVLFVSLLIGSFLIFSINNKSIKENLNIIDAEKKDNQITSAPEDWEYFTDSFFPVTFRYPPDWTRKSEKIESHKFPTYYAETISSNTIEGCSLFLGIGGGDGPNADEVTNDEEIIGDVTFDRRTWIVNGQPFFVAYFEREKIDNFELFLIKYPKGESNDKCQSLINEILDTFEFNT